MGMFQSRLEVVKAVNGDNSYKVWANENIITYKSAFLNFLLRPFIMNMFIYHRLVYANEFILNIVRGVNFFQRKEIPETIV